jgi:hypothetical protein
MSFEAPLGARRQGADSVRQQDPDLMPRRKPQGWPKLMASKRLKTGVTAYYWAPPTWALKAGCPVGREALGIDYGVAKERCDVLLNPQFDAWRLGAKAPALPDRIAIGTFDWLVGLYKSSPKYRDKPPKTRKSYDAVLRLVADYSLTDGRGFGTLSFASIVPGAADRLYEKLQRTVDGRARNRTAVLAMRVCQRAWNIAYRDRPDVVPHANPFAKMGLSYKPKTTRAVTFGELTRFVAAADAAGEASLGTAAMIAFFWLQREEDILKRLSWSDYRAADAPRMVRIFHHKTGVRFDLPLFDPNDGSALWPKLMERLDCAPRHGPLIVTRDRPDRRSKIHLPWKEDYFRHRFAAVRTAAGIDENAKFMGLRHGGNVEGAEAGLTDAQLRALSGHKTTAALLRYAQETEGQRVVAARKRRAARTNRGEMSE